MGDKAAIDLHIARQGQDHRISADWLYRLFRLSPRDLAAVFVEGRAEGKVS